MKPENQEEFSSSSPRSRRCLHVDGEVSGWDWDWGMNWTKFRDNQSVCR